MKPVSKRSSLRPLSALLLCALLASTAASCGAETPAQSVNTAAPGGNDTAPAVTETETEAELITLPKDLDYGGANVTVLGWDTYEDVEFFTETENGEVVNDAVFQRNLAVKERLNVDITFLEDGGRSGDSAWINLIRNANKAGDSAYDIAAGHSQNIGSLMHNGELLNLLDYDYLNISQPWWREELTKRALIMDNLFFATGDISPSAVARTQGIFFNSDILSQFDLEDPYQLVVDGKWTFEKLKTMASGIYADLNADGKHDEAGDRFGFAIDSVQLQAIALSNNIISVESDSEGLLRIPADYMSDRTVSILDAWISLIKDSEDSVIIKTVDDANVFRSGRALFYAFPLGLISSELRDCTFNIGFVPYPKFDEQQDGYTTCTSNAYSLWCIPLAASDPMRSAAVMEALGYEGYKRITPAMFEVAYKVKYNNTGSELQSQVFDILRAGLTFDIGRIMSSSITNSIFTLFPNAISSGKNNLASKYASVEKTTIKALDKWMDELANRE